MTVALANAVRKSWFAYTNNEKAQNVARADRIERKATSLCQEVAVVDDSIKVLKTTSRGSRCVNAIADAMKNTKSTSKLLDWMGVVAKWASKLVNPMLCVAGAARAWSKEDKLSGTVQEVGALGTMFVVEGLIKKNFGLDGAKPTYKNNKILKGLVDGAKKFSKNNKWLGKLPQGKLGAIAKAGIFVIGSITGFAVGEQLGKLVAKHTTEPYYQKRHPEKGVQYFA